LTIVLEIKKEPANLDRALALYKNTTQPNNFVFNALIGAARRVNQKHRVLFLADDVVKCNINDAYTIGELMAASVSNNNKSATSKLWKHACKLKMVHNSQNI
jgi:hypothetical protein